MTINNYFEHIFELFSSAVLHSNHKNVDIYFWSREVRKCAARLFLLGTLHRARDKWLSFLHSYFLTSHHRYSLVTRFSFSLSPFRRFLFALSSSFSSSSPSPESLLCAGDRYLFSLSFSLGARNAWRACHMPDNHRHKRVTDASEKVLLSGRQIN